MSSPHKWIYPNPWVHEPKDPSPEKKINVAYKPPFRPGKLTPGIEDSLRETARILQEDIDRQAENLAHPYKNIPWTRVATRLRELADKAEEQFQKDSETANIDILVDDSLNGGFITHSDGDFAHSQSEKEIPKNLTPEIIHIMNQGSTLCNMRGSPQDWPAGHTRVAVEDFDKATCKACKVAHGIVWHK